MKIVVDKEKYEELKKFNRKYCRLKKMFQEFREAIKELEEENERLRKCLAEEKQRRIEKNHWIERLKYVFRCRKSKQS